MILGQTVVSLFFEELMGKKPTSKPKPKPVVEAFVEPYEDHQMMIYFEGSHALHATEKGLLCRIRTSETESVKEWVPRSKISDLSEVKLEGDRGALVIPRWLAIDKKLIRENLGLLYEYDF